MDTQRLRVRPQRLGAAGETKHSWKHTAVLTIAAIVAAVLGFGALPAVAQAAPGNLGLSISNGGKTTVTSKTEDISFEAKISLPGVVLEAGATTTLVLDSSLKRTNNGPLPNGATAQTWNESTNTLTVTWGALQPGSFYSLSVNAKPSPLASKQSTFQATATTSGSVAGSAIEQTVTSTPIVAEGSEFPDAPHPAPKPGELTLSDAKSTVAAGGRLETNLVLTPVASGVTFRDLRVVTLWDEQVGTDNKYPRNWFGPDAWNNGSPRMNPSHGLASTLTGDSAQSTTWSYGSVPVAESMKVYVNSPIPGTAEPGRYSVPIEVQDRVDGDIITIARGVLTLIVPEPAAADLKMNVYATQTKLASGELLKWGQGWTMPSVSGTLKDLTVTYEIPEEFAPRGLYSVIQGIGAKAAQYTTDHDLESATWQALPLSGRGKIDMANTDNIRGVRFVLNDAKEFRTSQFGGSELTLEMKPGVAPGTTIPLSIASVTYVDPVVGPTALPLTAGHTKSVTASEEHSAPALAGMAETGTTDQTVASPFGKTYATGASFSRRIMISGAARTPVESPYVFVVVPAGMSTDGFAEPDICAPLGFSYVWGCSSSVFSAYPATGGDRGMKKLSDGSTLYYAQATTGLLDVGRTGYTQLFTNTKFTIDTLLAGKHELIIGGGSMVQSDLAVDAARNDASYELKSLSDPATFGTFAPIGGEIADALKGIGVSADNAFISAKNVSVSQSTSLSSITTIKGSEDSKPIAQGAGTATTRPGGNVNYEVQVKNTGSAVYKNFQFIDVLPRTGDTQILNESASRDSAFDVNLSGNVKVLVNGKASAGARLEYSTSLSPVRFDANGAEVPGDAWLPYTGSATGAMAIRVTLAPSAKFSPGDTVTLSFDATVPSSAPRNGETAKNSIAYRFQAGSGDWIAAETPSVAVKSSAPAGDIALAGQAVLDLNKNGTADSGEPGLNGGGVALQLYKMEAGKPVAVSSPVTPNTDAGVDGAFSFIGLEDAATYRIKPVSSNPNITFPGGLLDAEGYLKYSAVADAGANGDQDTSAYVGKVDFKVGTLAGISKWIKDLRLPVVAKTTVAGSVQLTDTTNSPLTSGTGAYVADVEVALKRGATIVKTTKTDASGGFSFAELDGVIPGDHTLVFTLPNGRELVASAANNAAVFTPGSGLNVGTYAMPALQPGVGAAGITVYLTETQVPTVSLAPTGGQVIAEARVNPTAGAIEGADAGTEVAKYAWQLRTSAGEEHSKGSLTADRTSFTIPADLGDGTYTLSVSATDLIGNTSAPAEFAFVVDRTAPVIAATTTKVTYAKGSPAAPGTAAGWIALYGVTADDGTGVGVASAGVTVDASAVKAAAGTYSVKFSVADAAGNTAKETQVEYIVAYVGDPTVMVGKTSSNYEMGTTVPGEAAWVSEFQVTAAAAHSSATIAKISVDSAAVDTSKLGEYPITFVATDSLGSKSVAGTGTVKVVDTITPTATVSEAKVAFAKGDSMLATDGSAAQSWIDLFGFAAFDSGSGIAASGVSVDATAVDYTTVGKYTVRFTATDVAGNVKSVTGEYSVNFAGDPEIGFTNPTVAYEIGTTRPSITSEALVALFGASSSTAAGTTQESLVADGAAIDFAVPGDYPVEFTVTDSAGNQATATATLRVADTTAPTITLGKDTVKFAQADTPLAADDHAAWIALFEATATDSGLGMPTTGTRGITVDASAVDYASAGDYPVTFTATDKAGLQRSVTGTYRVTFAGAPTIDLRVDSVSYEMGDPALAGSSDEWIALFGAVGKPAAGTTVKSLTADASAVNYSEPGSYQVILTVVDSYDNAATSFATVVVEDTQAPKLTAAHSERTFARGDVKVIDAAGWISLFGASATDAGTGVGGIAVDASAVDYATAGSYDVVFTATDKAGNVSSKSTVTYLVKFAGAPTVAFDSATVIHELGDAAPADTDAAWTQLFGATATTAPGTTVQSVQVDASSVKLGSLGNYPVFFLVTDSYGNADNYSARLKVVDTKAPVLEAANETAKHPMAEPTGPLTVNDWSALFGLTAGDGSGSGIDSASWSFEHEVNWLVPGTYKVKISVSDIAGNLSEVLERELVIQAPPAVESVTSRVAQARPVTLEPLAEAVTTGSLRGLEDNDLGIPSAGGTVTRDGDRVVYTPKPGFFGTETVSITVTDDLGQTAQREYTFTVVAAPAVADEAAFVYEVPVDGAVSIPKAVELPGITGEELRIVGVTTPAEFVGVVSHEDGTVSFDTDGSAWSGEQEFTMVVSDDLGQEAEVPVRVIVLAPVFTSETPSGRAGIDTINVSATGLVPGREYIVEMPSKPIELAAFTADAAGNGAVTVKVPAVAEVGKHSLVLLNDDREQRGSADFTVLAKDGLPDGGSSQEGQPGSLSATGTSVALLLGFALLLLLGGATAVGIVRRRAAVANGEDGERSA